MVHVFLRSGESWSERKGFGQSYGPSTPECCLARFLEAQGHCDTGLVSCSSQLMFVQRGLEAGFKEWLPSQRMPWSHFSRPGPLLLPTFFMSIWIQIKKLHQELIPQLRDMSVGQSCGAPQRPRDLNSNLNFMLPECGQMSQGPRCWNEVSVLVQTRGIQQEPHYWKQETRQTSEEQ